MKFWMKGNENNLFFALTKSQPDAQIFQNLHPCNFHYWVVVVALKMTAFSNSTQKLDIGVGVGLVKFFQS